jgi:hypothetical protein
VALDQLGRHVESLGRERCWFCELAGELVVIRCIRMVLHCCFI